MVSIYVYVQNLDYGVVSNLDYPPTSEATYLNLTAQNV